LYKKRKEHIIKSLMYDIKVLSNKARFIKEQCDSIIDLRMKKRDVVIELLKERNYDTIDDAYTYLVKMPIDSVYEENITKLLKDCQEKQILKETLEKTTIIEMWTKELLELKNAVEVYRKERIIRLRGR